MEKILTPKEERARERAELMRGLAEARADLQQIKNPPAPAPIIPAQPVTPPQAIVPPVVQQPTPVQRPTPGMPPQTPPMSAPATPATPPAQPVPRVTFTPPATPPNTGPATPPQTPSGPAQAPATPANTPPEATPKTPEEIENDRLRTEYFALKNKKAKEQGPTYASDLSTAENAYKDSKKKVVEACLARTGTFSAKEFLLKEVESNRKNDLDNGHIKGKEKIRAVASKTIEKWDNLGNAPGKRGIVERFAKTGISLGLIGVASFGAVHALASTGLPFLSTTALGGNLTSFLTRRVGLGIGFSSIVSSVHPKYKKLASLALVGGLTFATGGAAAVGMAAGGLVLSSGIGLTLARLTKKYDKVNDRNMGSILGGQADFRNIDADISVLESEMERALKSAEKARIWGKAREAGIALASSVATLELMGHHQDDQKLKSALGANQKHEADLQRENAALKAQHQTDANHARDLDAQHEADARALEAAKNNPNSAPATPDANSPTPDANVSPAPAVTLADGSHPPLEAGNVSPANPAGTPEVVDHNLDDVKIVFEHGKGAIQGILDLKHELNEQYNGDFSHAPKSVQDFMHTDATKEAMKLGLFDPSAGDGKESAMLHEGDVLKFDSHGNLLLGKPDADGNIAGLGDKFHGTMFHSGHNAPENNSTAETNTVAPKTEGDVDPYNFKPHNALEDMIHDEQPLPDFTHSHHIDLTRERILAELDKHTGSGVNVEVEVNNHLVNTDAAGGSDIDGLSVDTTHAQVDGQLSADDAALLRAHPELLQHNPFHLTPPQLVEYLHTQDTHLHKIFPENTSSHWAQVKAERASDILKGNPNAQHNDGFKHMISYAKEIQRVSGEKPLGSWLSHHETLQEWLARASQKIEKAARWNEVKLP